VKINYKCIKDSDNIGLDVRDLIIDDIFSKDNTKLSFVIIKNKFLFLNIQIIKFI
jgi:hypothetical protein